MSRVTEPDWGFGKLIRDRRVERKIPLYSVAARVGITSSTLSKWERGITLPNQQNPGRLDLKEVMPKLAHVLGLAEDVLWSMLEDPRPPTRWYCVKGTHELQWGYISAAGKAMGKPWRFCAECQFEIFNDPTDPRHGANGFNYWGCRCQTCFDGNRARHKIPGATWPFNSDIMEVPEGTRFGRWTVIDSERIYQRSGQRNRPFLWCRCDCGTERLVRLVSLRHKRGSCGCGQRETMAVVNRRGGGKRWP